MVRRHVRWTSIGSLVIGLVWASTAVGQSPKKAPPKRPTKSPSKAPASRSSSRSGVKPYDSVITKEAKTQVGLFRVHRIKDQLYYEIPPSQFGQDMLWVVQIEQTQAGFGYAGAPVLDRIVRWELRGEKVLLRDVKYSIRASGKDSIRYAVERTSLSPIIKTFSVKAWGKDKAPVIDVTSLFTSDVKEISAARAVNGSAMDSSRTFLDSTKVFPTNIETRVLATYRIGSSSRPSMFGRSSSTRRDPTQSGVTALVHHSMVVLPARPMKPRVHDERVGFFTVGFRDFTKGKYHEVEEIRYITRWRLEKKDPKAAVSEPVKPIVFYVGRGVPDKWKPYIKKGIEMWKPAFEKAGFKNAIIGKMAPGEHEDPNWDAEDARISTIRWLPSTVENAFGPHVHDPRTGEILEADIRMYHNVLKLARDWYFVQASPNDKRAQKLPLPDELVGELLAYIVAHEVGHSLGFPHNMKASSAFSIKNLRDPKFTKQHGTEASIMDYGRFNYVAQPGDGAALIPKIGPYDYFAVEWGYRQYPDDKMEAKGRQELLARQVKDRMLLFGNADPSEDPTRQTEDLGNDSIEATRLGLANLDRVAGYLIKACCNKGQDYDLLKNMYGQVWNQRNRELMHVTAVVGGFEQKNLYIGDADQVYHPIPAERQRQAVAFLIKHGFQTPSKLVDPAILLRLEAGGVASRVLGSQQGILASLIRGSRVDRMTEHAARAAAAKQPVYAPADMLADLRKAIWSELDKSPIEIDLYRRNLQRAHVERLISALSGSASSDLPALARFELQAIHGKLSRTLGRPQTAKKLSPIVRAHLSQMLARITDTFNAQKVKVSTSSSSTTLPRRRADELAPVR